MFDLDKWQEIYSSLKKHKLRTLLTAFGVFWGIFMLVLLLGAGKGLENGVLDMFSDNAVNTIWVWSGQTTVPHEGLAPGRHIEYTNDDVKAIRQNIREVAFISPRTNLWGEFTVSYGGKNGSFSINGESPDLIHIKAFNMSAGRFINEPDIRENRKVAVIGERVVELLFGNEDPMGKYINIKGAYFKVVGTFKKKKSGGDSREDAQTIYMPYTTLQRTYNQGSHVNMFCVRVRPGVPAKVAEDKIRSLMASRHKFSTSDDQAMGVWNAEEEFKSFTGLFAGINTFIWIVGIGSIIAGIVGVSNIMLIIVKERTREIGTRKALGATPGSIVSMIIQEAVVITAVSGYMGLVAGVALIELVQSTMEKFGIESEFFKRPEIEFSVAITATVLLVIAGALAGFIPARKAARINPIEALRTE
jgi:putative ABC transport system permease protein